MLKGNYMLKIFSGESPRLEQRFELDTIPSPRNQSYAFGFLRVKEVAALSEKMARLEQKVLGGKG